MNIGVCGHAYPGDDDGASGRSRVISDGRREKHRVNGVNRLKSDPVLGPQPADGARAGPGKAARTANEKGPDDGPGLSWIS
jgi:hypothetical protein